MFCRNWWITAAVLLSLLNSSNGQEEEDLIIQDTQVSYVMEPFEAIEDGWFRPDDLNLTLSKDALFGSHALHIELLLDTDSTEFGWVLPTRPHNCFGAKYLSLWYKTLQATANASLRVTLFDDRTCLLAIQLLPEYNNSSYCADPDRLYPFLVIDRELTDDSDDWQEIRVDTSLLEDIDLRHLRGWKVEIGNATSESALLLDQLSCVGGGNMLSSAFHIGSQTTFRDAVEDGTWIENYYQSEASQNFSQPLLQDGQLHVDPYMVEQAESWGGFDDFAHLAPGASYYNLSQATDLVLDYFVNEIASIPGRAIFRLVLQDNSHCEEDCDTDYHAHERWYSFHSILDQAGGGRIVIPLQGSVEPTTPFWLTGWSGITGNSELDIAELKGFSFELNLDSVLELGEVISGSVSFFNMAAAITPDIVDAEIAYVMEPFEGIHEEWSLGPLGDLETLNLTIIEGDDVLFGNHSLLVEYTGDSQFRWLLKARAHNCFGADYLSLWYKSLDGAELRITIFEDSSCLASNRDTPFNCADPDNIEAFVVFSEEVPPTENNWKEIRMTNLTGIDLRRVRGWQIQLIGSGSLWLDQLAFVGGGALLGSPFEMGDATFQDALSEGSWMETYYESESSHNNSLITLSNGELGMDYAVEQAEAWGGFIDFSHLAPGPAYYNLSKATDLLISYNIMQAASIPGRAIFRFILQDNSNCEGECDSDYHAHERWYSFHSILDDEGPGQLVIPLQGSVDPTTPWWLTGWSGITGNQKLDTTQLKGYTLEVVLDSVLDPGTLVSGNVAWFGMSAAISQKEPEQAFEHQCIPEADLYILAETAPHFTRIEFLGAVCCETCAEDPDCLYALSTGRDCYVASYIEPSDVGLLHTDNQQSKLTSFWMDDATKRGGWCDRCTCFKETFSIDCKGRNLAIIPKTFEQSWSPQYVDLRENPRLVLLGSGSLSAIGESLEEIWLPISMRHIALQSLEDLPKLKYVQIEGDQDIEHYFSNAIAKSTDFFSNVCCGFGSRIDLSSPGDGLTFCNMQISLPGIDAAYEDFITYIDALPLQALTPSSNFMSEAAESVEKCAEYCAINNECRFFSYDARLPNAEHICLLLQDTGTRTEYVCCDEDHYYDEERTIPGWISGRPPQTRHELDNARVLVGPQNLNVDKGNGYVTEYEVSLGSSPLRGAVWVEPTLVTTSMDVDETFDFEVSISPSRVVLYDETQTATVTIQVHDVPPGSQAVNLVIQNVIVSCDKAYLISGDSQENIVYVTVSAPDTDEETNLALAIALPIALVLIVGLGVFLFYEQNRNQNDSVWKVKKEELHFTEPPEIIGRGTFGLVLLAEYRGTQVAVKRVIPQRDKKKKHGGMDSGSQQSTSDTSNPTNPGMASGMASGSSNSNNIGMQSASSHYSGTGSGENVVSVTSSGYNVGKTSWGALSVGGASGRNGMATALSSVSGVFSKRLKYSVQNSDEAHWRKLKKEFVEEMRYLSKLRHPCVTTVMGAVISKNVEPMLVMEYMDHGSLYDILHNETMIIEGGILLPILRDISQGVRFLHSATPEVIHGDLKAQNILVDSRFRAKVADFGLSQKKNLGGTGTPFWMAPELLRGESSNTTASDVYSFGIILYEVYSRRDPYEGEDALEVLRLVADKSVRKRPPVPASFPSQVQSLMEDCILDEAGERPTFEELDTRLKRVDAKAVDAGQVPNKATSISLFDIFPRHIAEALRDGRIVEPEHRDVVTIFFSDIVGFTSISSELEPRKVASLLDRLYTKLDELSRKHDVFKVETIGDAYMAVTNLVKDQPDDHAKRIAGFAIDAIKAANGTYIDMDDHDKGFVNLRVGFHSGAVVADVVGTRNPRYCLFGDTVNTASRMESNSKVNRIHCSSAAAEILMDQVPELPLKSRGLVAIKGKGDMHTFWVNEEGAGRSSHARRISDSQRLSQSEMSMLEWAATGNKSEAMETLKEEAHTDIYSSEMLVEKKESKSSLELGGKNEARDVSSHDHETQTPPQI